MGGLGAWLALLAVSLCGGVSSLPQPEPRVFFSFEGRHHPGSPPVQAEPERTQSHQKNQSGRSGGGRAGPPRHRNRSANSESMQMINTGGVSG